MILATFFFNLLNIWVIDPIITVKVHLFDEVVVLNESKELDAEIVADVVVFKVYGLNAQAA